MKRRIFARVFVGYAVVSLIAVAVFAVYTLRLAREITYDALTRGLQSTAVTARVSVLPLIGRGRTPELDALVAGIGQAGAVRLSVIDAKGVVLADSQEYAPGMENHGNRPEVARAMAGEIGTASRFSGTVRRWMIYVAIPALDAGRVIGVVRASMYADELETATVSARSSLVLFAAILLVACLLSSLLFSRSLTAPLRDLAGVVGRFAAGDFGARLHLRRRDEIKMLADSFNAMGERVQLLFLERARQTQELDGIFSSVQQGILVLDRAGRILRANRGFEELARNVPLIGKTLWEVVRAPRLTELVQSARETGQRRSEEVAIGDRTILCTVEHMEGREELIVVLNDVTDIRRLEEVKRDFVVNASHELRTPLTAILGSLEMLEGVELDDASRWIDAIRRNSQRMSAIVQDLLLLSRLEARGAELTGEPVDLRRLAEDVTGMFAHRAEMQGISLTLSVPAELPTLQADAQLIEEMLINLVDNALKYTEKGSVSLSCTAPDADHVAIEVADTGIGIPEESLSRIFERFYVVDKSRSRKLGGTGLGLAIVKHIVGSHGGTIEVHSELGKGTRFRIVLPRKLTQN